MLPQILRRRAAALVMTAALAACGDATTEPTDNGVSASVAATTTADVATVSGDAASEDVQLFKVNAGAFGYAQFGDYERFSGWNSCPYDAAAARFICAPVTRGPFVHKRSYAFLDASGTAQSSYGALTTAQANFTTSLTGTITKERWSGTMSRERNFTISGLAGNNTTVTINGTGAVERQRSRFDREAANPGTVVRSYDLDGSLTISNVVVAVASLPQAWPSSGTVTRRYTVTRTDAAGATTTTTRTAVVTFNGTQFVPLVVNGTEFTIDLTTGVVVKKA